MGKAPKRRSGKSGIGRLCDLAVALHLGDPLAPVIAMHKESE